MYIFSQNKISQINYFQSILKLQGFALILATPPPNLTICNKTRISCPALAEYALSSTMILAQDE